jgi:hypothetical protein
MTEGWVGKIYGISRKRFKKEIWARNEDAECGWL